MAFNTANLLTTKYGSKGLLNGKEEITLDVEIPNGYWTEEANEDAPLYKFVYREAFGFHLEPIDQPEGMYGPMANGVYAEVDSLVVEQLSKKAGYPVSKLIRVHDRFETPEQNYIQSI
tara:strand:+ start:70 stop:423 length:354 start_codon:yes stop_codon:yes gene_type:complete